MNQAEARTQQAGLTFAGKLWLAVALVSFIAVSLIGLRLGFGSHGDSRAIVERSVPAILDGHYEPSRSLGNPLYEAVASLLYPLGGLTLLNTYSLFLSLASIAIFIAHLRAQGSPITWAVAGFIFNPLFLIEAASSTEWAQATFFFVAAIALAQRWLDSRQQWQLVLYGVAICALVLTRPDFWLACLALFVAVLWQLKLERRPSFIFTATNAAAALIALLVFVAINDGLSSLGGIGEMSGETPLLRRMVVAIFGFVDIFGLLGSVTLVVGTVILARGLMHARGRDATLAESLFLVLWPLLIIRFAVQPDKLEYLIPLIPVSLLAMSTSRQPRLVAAILALSLIVSSFLSVSFFERSNASDQLKFSARLNEGALFQDWADRRAVQRALDPEFLNNVSEVVYAGEGGAAAHAPLNWKMWDLGLTNADGDLVISEDQLYKLNNDRFNSELSSSENHKRIFVCNQPLVPLNTGWRVLQPPPEFLSFDDGKQDLRCWFDRSTE